MHRICPISILLSLVGQTLLIKLFQLRKTLIYSNLKKNEIKTLKTKYLQLLKLTNILQNTLDSV